MSLNEQAQLNFIECILHQAALTTDDDDDEFFHGYFSDLAKEILDYVTKWTCIEDAYDNIYDGRRLLLYVPKYGPSTGHYDKQDGLWILHSVLNHEAVPTHFQYLAKPPEEY